MHTTKNNISELIDRLPEDSSLEDIQYHLFVIQKIERGLKDVEEGRTFSHEEVKRMMSKWLEK
jgi:predicted transcriptional regulator